MENNMDYIPIEKLKDGWLYKIDGRNANLGIYIADEKAFFVRRCKFGHFFVDKEIHWDADDHYGTVKPLEEIEFAGHFVNDDERLVYLNKKKL